MKLAVLSGAFTMALAVTTIAQQPQAPWPPAAQPPAPQAQAQAAMVTVEGCVMREADVPGLKPNVAERAGITDDFILTAAKMVKGSAPAGIPQAKPGDAATGTSGAHLPMYEIEGIDDARLKQHVGRRVQIDGTFADLDRARATAGQVTNSDDLVEIRATAIREVPGTCPSK